MIVSLAITAIVAALTSFIISEIYRKKKEREAVEALKEQEKDGATVLTRRSAIEAIERQVGNYQQGKSVNAQYLQQTDLGYGIKKVVRPSHLNDDEEEKRRQDNSITDFAIGFAASSIAEAITDHSQYDTTDSTPSVDSTPDTSSSSFDGFDGGSGGGGGATGEW